MVLTTSANNTCKICILTQQSAQNDVIVLSFLGFGQNHNCHSDIQGWRMALRVVFLACFCLAAVNCDLPDVEPPDHDVLSARMGQQPNLASFVASDAKLLGSPLEAFQGIKSQDFASPTLGSKTVKAHPTPFIKPRKRVGHLLLKKVAAPKVKKFLAKDVVIIKKKMTAKKFKAPKLKKLPLALKPILAKPKVKTLEPIVHVIEKPVPVFHKVPVPKKVLVPKFIPVPKIIPIPKIIPVPYKVPVIKVIPKVVKIPKAIPFPKIVPIKKHIPIGIPVPVPKIFKFPVLKPVPYKKPIPIPFPKPFFKPVPVPIKKLIKIPKPYYVPVKVPYITKSYVKIPTVVPVPTTGKTLFSKPKALPNIPNFGGHFGSGKSYFAKDHLGSFRESSTTDEKPGDANLERLLSVLDSMQRGS